MSWTFQNIQKQSNRTTELGGSDPNEQAISVHFWSEMTTKGYELCESALNTIQQQMSRIPRLETAYRDRRESEKKKANMAVVNRY